eukprot:4522430-Pleurochrysis_carterae.AAC.1
MNSTGVELCDEHTEYVGICLRAQRLTSFNSQPACSATFAVAFARQFMKASEKQLGHAWVLGRERESVRGRLLGQGARLCA